MPLAPLDRCDSMFELGGIFASICLPVSRMKWVKKDKGNA